MFSDFLNLEYVPRQFHGTDLADFDLLGIPEFESSCTGHKMLWMAWISE